MAKDIIFNVQVNAGKAETDIDKVNEAVKDTTKSTDGLNKTLDATDKELKSLTSRLGETQDKLYQLALEGKENTKEFKDLQTEASNYKRVLVSVDSSIDQLASSGRGLSTALEIGSHITNGYQAVVGVQALLGVESEALIETMVKLQGAQAVLNSLEQAKLALEKQSIVATKLKGVVTAISTKLTIAQTMATQGATIATRLLGAAMIALPIFAIIAGLVALIMWLKKTADENKAFEDSNANLTKSYDQLISTTERYYDKQLKDVDNAIKLAKSENATREDLHKMELERLEILESKRRVGLIQEADLIKQKQVAYKQALARGNTDLAISIKEEIQQHRDKYAELKSLDGQHAQDVKVVQNNFNNETAKIDEDAQKKRADASQRAREARKQAKEKADQLAIERQKLFEDLTIENIANSEERQIAQLLLSYARQEEELIKKYGKEDETIKLLESKRNAELTALNESFDAEYTEAEKVKQAEKLEALNRDAIAKIERELLLEKDNFDTKQQLLKDLALVEMQQVLQNEDLTANEKLLIQEQYADRVIEIDKETAERQKQIRDENIKAITDGYSNLTSSLQGLSDGMFEYQLNNVEKGSAQELEVRKKQFEINKKQQIAQAIMQGYQAVLAAYSSGSAIPIIGAVAGPAFAALAGVTAIASIKKIKSSNFNGGSASMGSGSVSVPTLPTAQAYNSTTSSTDGFVNGQNGSDNTTPRVVIVDSDIKASQNKMNKIDVISAL